MNKFNCPVCKCEARVIEDAGEQVVIACDHCADSRMMDRSACEPPEPEKKASKAKE
jgi:transcription elongation factor Elf1